MTITQYKRGDGIDIFRAFEGEWAVRCLSAHRSGNLTMFYGDFTKIQPRQDEWVYEHQMSLIKGCGYLYTYEEARRLLETITHPDAEAWAAEVLES